MRIDVTRGTPKSGVAMEITMADVGVELVCVYRQVGMRERASLVFVRVGMYWCPTVSVRVDVHYVVVSAVGVVVVSGPVRVRNISVILIGRIRVIAMAGIQVIRVGHIQVIVVRGGIAVVVVIAMAHIPVVRVRRVLNRAIEMARAADVGMILVGGCIAVIRMERNIKVIGMPGVGVVIETAIAMHVGMIAMIEVGIAMTVEMRRGI
jgi:hypothetical protein